MSIGFKDNGCEERSGNTSKVCEHDDLREDSVKSKQWRSTSFLDNKAFLICVLLIIIVTLILGIYMTKKRKETNVTDGTEYTLNETINKTETDEGKIGKDDASAVYDEEGNVTAKDAINPGVIEYEEFKTDSSYPTTAEVFEDSDYIKDLNGVDVAAVYNVKNASYVYDYVNYEKRRAIIDDGMELYWLEATYQGKKYRIQTPFYYFKNLSPSGICKVEMEILTLEGRGKIISYMQVVEDSVQ